MMLIYFLMKTDKIDFVKNVKEPFKVNLKVEKISYVNVLR